MKKIAFIMAIFVGLTLSLQARDWNIPKGSYTCQIISINDEHWKPVKYLTENQRKNNTVGFVLDDTKIVDAAGLVFIDNGDNSEGTNNLIATDFTNAIYIPTSNKKDGKYFVGIGHVVGGKVLRMAMSCTKDN